MIRPSFPSVPPAPTRSSVSLVDYDAELLPSLMVFLVLAFSSVFGSTLACWMGLAL